MSDQQQFSRSSVTGKRRPRKEVFCSRAQQRARTNSTSDKNANEGNSRPARTESPLHPFSNEEKLALQNGGCEEYESEAVRTETEEDGDEGGHLQCDRNVDHQYILQWRCHRRHTSLEAEESLIPILVKYGERERNMMCNHPPHRLHQIKRACHRLHVPLAQALSLRRHHIKRLNPFASMPSLLLGSNDNIRCSAALFEESVALLLHDHKIEYWDEEDQKRSIAANGDRLIATPDFLLKRQILIRISVPGKTKYPIKPHPVCWIDAKMFYGASSIEQDNRSAVGCLLAKAQKYVQLYGPGAFIFMNGCGAELALQLKKEGVIALDCAEMISIDRVQEHQRTWCADSHGNILP